MTDLLSEQEAGLLELCAWWHEEGWLCHLLVVLCPAVQSLKAEKAAVERQWPVGIAVGSATQCLQHLQLLPPAITETLHLFCRTGCAAITSCILVTLTCAESILITKYKRRQDISNAV